LGSVLNTVCVPSTTTACLIDANLANDGTPALSGKSGYHFTSVESLGAGAVVLTSSLPAVHRSARRLVPERIVRLMTVSCAPSLPANIALVGGYGACQLLTRWLTNISQFGKVAQSSEGNFAALLFFPASHDHYSVSRN